MGIDILFVGLACVDITSYVDRFPNEDECVRSVAQSIRRGGNASNSACVASLLGRAVAWSGSLGRSADPMALLVVNDLKDCGVVTHHCITRDASQPVASIIVNQSQATRTIVLNNQLPDFSDTELQQIPWHAYRWVHIEIRPNFDALQEGLRTARQSIDAEGLTTVLSLELEKPRPKDLNLAIHGDVVFFSKEFAECIFRDSLGSSECTPEAFLEWVVGSGKLRQGALAICAWGASGARARRGHETFTSLAFPPPGGIKDPVGAGDTFNGTMISALSLGWAPQEALGLACQVAGFKIGVFGFKPIREISSLCPGPVKTEPTCYCTGRIEGASKRVRLGSS